MAAKKGLMGGRYKLLTEGDIKAIHQTTVRLFQDPGVEINNRDALALFEQKGAEVDWGKRRVRVSQTMLEDALDKAPSRVILCGREGEHDLYLEGTRTYMGSGGTVLNVLDLETGDRRPSTMKDVADIARLVDALEDIHFLVIPVYPTEIPIENVDLNRFYWSLANTSKHVMGGVYTSQGIKDVIKMAEEIAGGAKQLRERPIISMITCVMNPLRLDQVYTGFLMEIAEAGIPLACPAEPLAGATSPCTLAGTITTSNIETLTGIILAQLVNPGTPTIYGTVASCMDMRRGSYLSGNVEMGLINAGAAQMAQFYRLPIYATAGMSDAKLPDAQAGFEKAATAMITALAGANYIHDAAGLLEFCTTACYEQYVIDAEILGMCMRAVRGIEVNEDTLAEEVVRRVGPGGNFLSEEHTLRHFRDEFFYPTVADRLAREAWEREGAKDGRARAREIAQKVLRAHKPKPIAVEIEDRILSAYPQIARLDPH